MADQISKQNHHKTTSTVTVIRWRCPNCGQTLFTTPDFEPPDLCAYCQDMTTWKRVETKQDPES